MVSPLPLVTAIMPTYNRPEFVRWAIELFHRQRYSRSELLILDDSDAGQRIHVSEGPRVCLTRFDQRVSMSEKHNRALALAQGELLVHWDDDDWSSPARILRQVEGVVIEGADVVGIKLSHVLSYGDGRFWMFDKEFGPRHGPVGNSAGDDWLGYHDGTALFRRSIVRGLTYSAHPVSQKVQFLRGLEKAGATVKVLENAGLFVYVRHSSNTWQYGKDRRLVSVPKPVFFPDADLGFYRKGAA